MQSRENKEILSKKIKEIRSFYHLSLMDMAGILQQELPALNSSTLYDWEKGHSFPGYERLSGLADVFGFSVDWLMGRSDIVYTEDSVRLGENAAYQMLAGQTPKKSRSWWIRQLSSLSAGQYASLENEEDHALREKVYTLSERARIAVLLRMVPLPDLYWAQGFIKHQYKKYGVLASVRKRLLREGLPVWSYKEPGKKAIRRAVWLAKLLAKKPAVATATLKKD